MFNSSISSLKKEKGLKEGVESSEILQKAMSLVGLARREILATMDLTEEIANPLPLEYFALLRKQIEFGVKVLRLAFGSESDFGIFNRKRGFASPNYSCVLSPTKNYRRMLLIDGRYLLFAVDIGNERRFFYSTDVADIEEFSCYFFNELKIPLKNSKTRKQGGKGGKG